MRVLSGNESWPPRPVRMMLNRCSSFFMVIIIASKLVQQQRADSNGTGRRRCE